VNELLTGYPDSAADEAVRAGRLRGPYVTLEPLLARLSEQGQAAVSGELQAERSGRGVVVGAWADGAHLIRPLPLDPVPRVLTAGEWTAVAAGVEQRHRALNAFLADAYRAAGRRRSDPDRDAEIVRAGVLPEWAVAHHPGRNPDAVGMAWPGQPRATVCATDLVRRPDGSWVATDDQLRVPSGLGYAFANRDSLRAAGLVPDGRRIGDPLRAVPLLRQALIETAPPACLGPPRIAVLTAGEGDSAWFEHRLLAGALDVPLVRARDLWPRMDGGVDMSLDGERVPVDVLYRRFDDAELGVHRSGTGQPLSGLLADAVRAGRLGVGNVPGNGLADDAATYALVPEMIRFYLDEEPLLASVPTWVLADGGQWAQTRDRLHELVLRTVDGYGGAGVVVGPACSAADLAALQAEVAAAPHRFVAQEPVECTTVPTVVDGRLAPRPVHMRVFSVAGATTRALPAPLTVVGGRPGVDFRRGGATKDTWLLG
jgi:carboxylate-amine ligase